MVQIMKVAPKSIDSRFARQIRTNRVRLNMDQAELAQATGLSRASISNIENSKQALSLNSFIRISYALKLSPSKLLDLALKDNEVHLGPDEIEDDYYRELINSSLAGRA